MTGIVKSINHSGFSSLYCDASSTATIKHYEQDEAEETTVNIHRLRGYAHCREGGY